MVDENFTHYENERIKLVKKFGVADAEGNISVQSSMQLTLNWRSTRFRLTA